MTILFAVLVLLAIVVAVPFVREALRPKMDDAARKAAPGHFVALSQGVTHYDWIGPARGPVAVCVHGLTTPSPVWRGLAQGLSWMGYRVLIYDLFGRGYSDRPAGPQDQAFFQRQLDDLLDSQGIKDDITLLGYSMGGAIATCFAASQPQRVRQLILLAPAGMITVRRRLLRYIHIPFVGDWLMLALYPRRHLTETEAERALPDAVPEIVDIQQNELRFRGFTPAVLASLRGQASDTLETEHRSVHRAGVPVLAIWGEDDPVIPLKAMGKLAEWSRNARQEVISGARHGLVYTHTDAVIEEMRATLREGLN